MTHELIVNMVGVRRESVTERDKATVRHLAGSGLPDLHFAKPQTQRLLP